MGLNVDFEPLPGFLLRVPLWPVSVLDKLPERFTGLIPYLTQLYEDPWIREAVNYQSPDLGLQIDRVLRANESLDSHPRMWLALLKLICRLSVNPVPFGLSAGSGLGSFGPQTRMILSGPVSHTRRDKVDFGHLLDTARRILSDPEILEELTWFPDTTLYRVGNQWHYIEKSCNSRLGRVEFQVSAAEDQGLLGELFALCREGCRLAVLRKFLLGKGNEIEDVQEFIESLIGSGILVSELEPVVCGEDYTGILEPFCNRLGFSVVQGPQIPVKTDILLSAKKLQLSDSLVQSIVTGIRLMRWLSEGRKTDGLIRFREAFIRRYGSAQVLLPQLLDPEIGIGLTGAADGYYNDPAAWIDDLDWSRSADPIPIESSEPKKNERLLPGTLSKDGLYHEIEASDLPNDPAWAGDLPDQFWCVGELFLNERGQESVFLSHATGGNPAHLASRLAADDPAVHDWIKSMIREAPTKFDDCLEAEVVHVPSGRAGNILRRPSFFEYEIPYMAHSAKPHARIIRIEDIRVSVIDNRVILFSNRHQKRIIPRMTTTYNPDHENLPVYRFLSRVINQDMESDWIPYRDSGSLFSPGIRFRNLVLLPPSWRVIADELINEIHPKSQHTDPDGIRAWRTSRSIPVKTVWMEGDKPHLVDFDNESLVLNFWEDLRRNKKLTLIPFYGGSTPVHSDGGCHANQLILAFRKKDRPD